jgi:hypothetical protein
VDFINYRVFDLLGFHRRGGSFLKSGCLAPSQLR